MTSPTVPEHISSSARGIGFTRRYARFLGRVSARGWRFVRSRKMLYLLAGGGMLVCALRFYENWNGAREWEAARQKVLARIGTERLMDVLPPEVAEADIFLHCRSYKVGGRQRGPDRRWAMNTGFRLANFIRQDSSRQLSWRSMDASA